MKRFLIGAALYVSAACVSYAQVRPVLPGGGAGDISASTSVANGASASRTAAARASDTFNPKDYGAIGDGTAHAIGTTYGASLTALAAYATSAGAHPFAWITNPVFGLSFSMTTSAAQGAAGTSLTFLQTVSGINGWTASVAAWQSPSNASYFLSTAMTVSGSCIAGGTTVSAIDGTVGDAGYGTVTLSQATSAACGSGTYITFTISPSQLQALSSDYLGIQSAMAAAWLAGVGGNVTIPSGEYALNHTLINPGGITNSSTMEPGINFVGSGQYQTRLVYGTDLGSGFCAITEGSRGNGTYSASHYHDFRLIGPNFSRVNGTFPNGMDGLCIGQLGRVERVNVSNMHAGINGVLDHWSITSSTLSNNGYGLYLGPYSTTIGNQNLDGDALVGNTIASIAVSSTNQLDSATLTNLDTGFSPYGFYKEATGANVTNPLSYLTNNVFTRVGIESVGNSWIYAVGQASAVAGNTFIGGGPANVTSNGFTISATPVPAVIYVGEFNNNLMINTNWGNYSGVTAAIVDVGDDCQFNTWIGDSNFVTSATTSVPPLLCSTNNAHNTFQIPTGSGEFRILGGGGSVVAGQSLYDFGQRLAIPYVEGKPFAGVSASAAANSNAIGVITSADSVVLTKASSSQAISAGQPVFVTSGGVYGGLDPSGSIGVAVGTSSSGSTTVTVNLDPGARNGSRGASTGRTAAGTTQGTAFAITSSTTVFSTVASGTGAILARVPVGEAVTIYNDGANALIVYPQTGGAINNGSTNAGVSVASGASATFRMISTTAWHS